MNNNILPENWLNVHLGSIIDYGKSDKAQPNEICNDTWVLELEDIEKNSSRILKKKYFVERQSKSTKNKFNKGDVLYGKLRPYLNKVVIADQSGVCTTEIVPIKCSELLNSKFIFFWLKSPFFLTYVTRVGHGVNMPRLGTEDGKKAPFILPPLAEQNEIARLLEQHLAQIEQIKAHLEAIPKLITTFRQSVLADAVSGKLTTDWRKVNRFDKIDIEDISTYWRTSYQAQNKKYKPFKANINSCITNVLPSSWQNTMIGCVCDVFVGSTPSRKMDDYWGNDINWVSSSEVAFCRINSTKERITKLGLENSSTNIHPKGTVLLAMIGQGKTRGQAAILDVEACHNQNTAALRIPANFMLSEYLYYFLVKKYEDTRLVGSGNNQKALNKTSVQSLELTLPPLEEQNEIVSRVEELFTFADNIERQTQSATEHVNLLTQSLLAKAFLGELTADWRQQNPELISGENSAEALLAKIQAQMKVDKTKKTTKS